MTTVADAAAALVAAGTPAVVVTVAEAKGSAPRGAGTAMVVTADGTFGTIGGGRLEQEATGQAREFLATGAPPPMRFNMALGPALGQCCGGNVALAYAPLTRDAVVELKAREATDQAGWPLVAVFGAGHVGTALTAALAPLPCRVLWVDDRADFLPEVGPGDADVRLTRDPAVVVDELPAGAYVVVMSHTHDLDFAICEKALARDDLAFVGLIGSGTKRAQLVNRLTAAGMDDAGIARLTCPIGVIGDGDKARDKSPAVIAALTAAQLLLMFDG